MIKSLLRKYRTWRHAKSQHKSVFINGTLLNAFYESKTIFIHIPKTAGVSLIRAIYGDVSLSGHRSFFFNSIVLDIKHEKYFSFTFVRNPFDRLFSTFMFLKKGGMNNHDRLAFDTYLSRFEDFEDFVLNGLDRKVIFEITHFIPQHEYLCDRHGNVLVDFVGRFENLENDVKLLSERLNKDIRLNHFNYNNKKDYISVYSEEMISVVSKIYEKDLTTFKYKFNKC